MKTTIAAVFVGVAVVNTASAGCFNYEETGRGDAPLVKICFDDTCDIVQQTFFCSSVDEAMAGFDGGWHFTFPVNGGEKLRIVSWNGTRLPSKQAARVTCEVLQGVAEGC